VKAVAQDNSRTVLSLCDYSGNWPRPYAEAGCTVVCLDLKHGDDLLTLPVDAVAQRLWDSIGAFTVRAILAAPLCTAFTNSASQHWPRHDADGTTEKCVALANACVDIVEYFKPSTWALENPRGRIEQLVPRLAGRCRFEFHPYHYAGWTEQLPVTMDSDVLTLMATNRYPKQTRIWGACVEPERRPLEPLVFKSKDGTKQGGCFWMKLGGKSERTKEIRSLTPMGFARAFHSANGCE
jgi:hypothetical protein